MNQALYHTLREQIVEQLRHDVLNGQLAEGEPLREQKLAARFGISRGPIRDALLQLTQEGLLVAQPNRGVRVGPRLGPAIRPLVVELRRRIEAFAVEQAMAKDGADDLAELEAILARFKAACRAGTMPEVVKHDMAFHRWIVERVGDADLLALWLSVVVRMRLQYTRHRSLMESFREHLAVVEALRAKDQAAAVKALEANIQ
jgi:GntR family transcriptional regulator, rspAB operon transcriptional repressor